MNADLGQGTSSLNSEFASVVRIQISSTINFNKDPISFPRHIWAKLWTDGLHRSDLWDRYMYWSWFTGLSACLTICLCDLLVCLESKQCIQVKNSGKNWQTIRHDDCKWRPKQRSSDNVCKQQVWHKHDKLVFYSHCLVLIISQKMRCNQCIGSVHFSRPHSQSCHTMRHAVHATALTPFSRLANCLHGSLKPAKTAGILLHQEATPNQN